MEFYRWILLLLNVRGQTWIGLNFEEFGIIRIWHRTVINPHTAYNLAGIICDKIYDQDWQENLHEISFKNFDPHPKSQ